MKVWLDDERPAPDGWVHVRTVDEAISLLMYDAGMYDVEEISLDHDLGTDPDTGYDVLLWIERHHHLYGYAPRIHIHTANPPARKRMEAAVAAIGRASA